MVLISYNKYCISLFLKNRVLVVNELKISMLLNPGLYELLLPITMLNYLLKV